MESGRIEAKYTKRVRILTQFLIFSLALNVGLVGTFGSTFFKDRKVSGLTGRFDLPFDKLDVVVLKDNQIVEKLSQKSFGELLKMLASEKKIEEGIYERDLALASLKQFHNFDLERALGIIPKKVCLVKANLIQLPIYLGLSDFEFQAAYDFAITERWPFTAKGLFLALKKQGDGADESLIEAFSLTSEFNLLKALFYSADEKGDVRELIALAISGKWETLEGFSKWQKKRPKVTAERKRQLLVAYLEEGSTVAAQWLLDYDRDFALTGLSDDQVINLIDRTPRNMEGFVPYAKEILASTRPPEVREKAAICLYEILGDGAPENIDFELAQNRFSEKPKPLIAKEMVASKPIQQPKLIVSTPAKKLQIGGNVKKHIVQPGESLWKIAKKYNVSVHEVVEQNGLESEMLKPGQELSIRSSSTPIIY